MSSDKDSSEATPKRIGPYRIEHRIGKGGMGSVFRAHDERLLRPVALKRTRTSSQSTAQLGREAQAIAQLSHPNIVQVYDLLSQGGFEWIVMELVDGPNLLQLLKQRRLEVEEIMGWAQGITRGLAAAHAQGIVHRDLKVENVVITAAGEAKILDFGLATGPSIWQKTPGKIRIGGTPRTMAPEQAMGHPTDHRTDLFSLGVLLYECIAGKSPFAEPNLNAHRTLWRVCTTCPPPLCELRSGVPVELSQLVERLLAKEPTHRPESAGEVLLALQRARNSELSKIQVLFVDDEPDHELLVSHWLRHLDHQSFELIFARNGIEALDILRSSTSPHLVFTDLRMPGMDGLELLEEMAELDQECVTVVVSAFGDMSNIRSAMNLGAFDFLIKPFDLEDLTKTLEKAAGQLKKIRESVRLRAENQLLDERDKIFRMAFARYLGGDPELGRIFGPLIEHARATAERYVILVLLEVAGIEDLVGHMPAASCVAFAGELADQVVTTVRRHHGEILRFDGKCLSISFSFLTPREVDYKHARACAEELGDKISLWNERVEETGAPPITAKLVVNSGEIMIDSSTGSMTGDLPETLSRVLDTCPTLPSQRITILETRHEPS